TLCVPAGRRCALGAAVADAVAGGADARVVSLAHVHTVPLDRTARGVGVHGEDGLPGDRHPSRSRELVVRPGPFHRQPVLDRRRRRRARDRGVGWQAPPRRDHAGGGVSGACAERGHDLCDSVVVISDAWWACYTLAMADRAVNGLTQEIVLAGPRGFCA